MTPNNAASFRAFSVFTFFLSLSLILFLGFGTGEAQAQIYKYKDASGRTVISDVPPPPGTATDIQPPPGKGGAETPQAPSDVAPNAKPNAKPNAGAEAPKKTLADRELESKKKQQEQQEKEEKAKREQEAAAQAKENCDRARNELGGLESGVRTTQTNEKGERSYLDDNQRALETERLRKIISDSCENN